MRKKKLDNSNTTQNLVLIHGVRARGGRIQSHWSLLVAEGASSEDASAAAATDCLREASASLGSVTARWTTPALVTRQLPALRFQAIWDTSTLPWAPLLAGLDRQYEGIRKEVMGTMDSIVWKGSGNDLRLSSNDYWDPHTSWDAVSLFWLGEWKSEACKVFSATCAALRRHERLLPFVMGDRRQELWTESEWNQGYQDMPSLGVKLYRLWPNSTIKPHVGSPGRLVTSLALSAPTGASLTVAGERRSWRAGEWVAFDDSFFHSVSNPSSESFRVVLALVCWHPDLMTRGAATRQGHDEV